MCELDNGIDTLSWNLLIPLVFIFNVLWQRLFYTVKHFDRACVPSQLLSEGHLIVRNFSAVQNVLDKCLSLHFVPLETENQCNCFEGMS